VPVKTDVIRIKVMINITTSYVARL
jgi:hypothetical protein